MKYKNKIKKIIKKMAITIGILIVLLVISVTSFIKISPEFGGKSTKEELLSYNTSRNYKDGKFINLGNIKITMSASDMFKVMKGMLSPTPNTRPDHAIEVKTLDSIAIADYNAKTRLIWFGHSAFLLQINAKNILIDPMFGDVPAPNPLLGGKRFSNKLPIEIEKLPQIDAVLISHDHYDHLDYGSIQKLKGKVSKFYTPLGVGKHLQEWGIEKERIIELDWWEDAKLDDITFRSTPAQHFSGRGLTDRDSTFWCSWIIASETENIFFSGDSGYAPHFKEIGEKYGPFDFAMLECGQYDKLWPDVHMFPEQTAQAGLDIRAKKIMPIHWGAFKLAQHSWTDPIERVSKKAKELNIELVSPSIGESIVIDNTTKTNEDWWKN